MPGFPLPFPIPGNGANDTWGGGWYNASSRGGRVSAAPTSLRNDDFHNGRIFLTRWAALCAESGAAINLPHLRGIVHSEGDARLVSASCSSVRELSPSSLVTRAVAMNDGSKPLTTVLSVSSSR